jgi:hypothetical protein
MKTITITITEELDAAAAAEARRRGLSKSELIRLSLSSVLTEKPAQQGSNLWLELAGFGNPDLTVDEGEIDETVYGS